MQLALVQPASAFLVMRSQSSVDGHTLGAVANAHADLHRRRVFDSDYYFVDEQFFVPRRGALRELVIKLHSYNSAKEVLQAIFELRLTEKSDLQVQLLRALEPQQILWGDDEYERENFRREGATDSQYFAHTTSCVKLVHLATGTAARSTAHRNQARNFEEAIQLLAALVNGEDLIAGLS